MPTGNGEIGINAWVEADGDLRFYLARTDAFDEACRLLKLGRVRVSFDPNPFIDGGAFEQALHLIDGTICLRFGDISVRLWVDANHPVIRLTVDAPMPITVTATLEVWRTAERELAPVEHHSAYGLKGGPFQLKCWPDVVVPDQPEQVVWYHRNGPTCYEDHMKQQSLADFIPQHHNPLENNTFGGVMEGDSFDRVDDRTLRSTQPSTSQTLQVHLHCAQTPTADQWIEQIQAQIQRVRAVDASKARSEHEQWWIDFWSRSYLFAGGDERARTVMRGYNRQRFIQACAGRGRFPIKFNGSLFTVDGRDPVKLPDSVPDADYRLWGGHYWHQNTRLAYWPMLSSGDWEMMQPFFRLYLDQLAISMERVQRYNGHGGALFPETMTVFGTYAGENYGWDRSDLKPGELPNHWIRMHICGMLETAAIMLDYYAYTGDDAFAKQSLVPFAVAVLQFYDEHYERGADGNICLEPSQSLETWQDTVNPVPDLAGLRYVAEGLLSLPEQLLDAAQRERLSRLADELPELPVTTLQARRQIMGERITPGPGGDHSTVPDDPAPERRALMPAEQVRGKRTNLENPELYAVFPYRFFQVGKPDLDVGVASYQYRHELVPQPRWMVEAFGTRYSGWTQDDAHAALLGLTEEAARAVYERFATFHKTSRFPAFWGPNYDWIPDQDHGSVGLIATQFMLFQSVGDKLHVLPAWPKAWDVTFKLHAPGGITVSCTQRHGQIESLDVQPAGAREQVVLPTDRG